MPPVSLLIKPASAMCNMRCKYCFYADVSDNRKVKSYGVMSMETLEILVKNAFKYAEYSATFAFQGGEPTLAGLDYYRELVTLQEKYNVNKIVVNNSIQTNGCNMDHDWARFFAKHNFLVGVSLDGTREIHNSLRLDQNGNGSYNAVDKCIKILESHNVQYNILCVVTNLVARHSVKVYGNLSQYKYLQFIPCIDDFDGSKENFSLSDTAYGDFLIRTFNLYFNDFLSGNYISIRNFDNYINILMGNSPELCSMNGFCSCYFVVEGDGSVYPCDFYVLDKWKLGNVKTHSFQELADCSLVKMFVDNSKTVNPKCEQCEFFPLCRGGCRRDRENPGSEELSLNRFCHSYIEFFHSVLPKMQQMAAMLGNRS